MAKAKGKSKAAELAAKMMGGSSPGAKKPATAPAAKAPVAAAKAAPAAKKGPPVKLAPAAQAFGQATESDESLELVKARGLSTDGKARWRVEVMLDTVDGPAPEVYSGDTATRFHLTVYRDEWGILFVHKGKRSHIRKVKDAAFVNGSDDYKLVKELPALASVGGLVKSLEKQHGIAWKRDQALVRSNLAGAKDAMRQWLAKL